MVAIWRKDIMRLMITERIMPRVWMHRQSMRQLSRREGAMHDTEEARKNGWWKCQQSNTYISPKNSLIIDTSESNQEVHKETSTPRRSVWGFGYACASSTHGVYCNIRTLQRLVIHLVARVLNRGFWFSKITRISQNTTSITNRQELLTPKVQTLL